MNRCFSLLHLLNAIKFIAACAYSTLAIAVFPSFLVCGSAPALAQSNRDGQTLEVPQNTVGQPGLRSFPPKALRGTMVVRQAPEIVLDGKADRLSPGARIRGPQNEFLMSSVLTGQEFVVNYTRESFGGVHEVWILTPAEQKQKLKSANTGRNYLFSSEENNVKVDDGKTPFDQLPKYKQ